MASTPGYSTSNLTGSWTLSSEHTSFPKANLQDGRQGQVCKMNAAAATWTLTADLTSAQDVTVIALCNHNFPSNTTVRIQKSATGAWAGEEVTVVATTAATAARSAAFTFTDVIGPHNARYWRILATFSPNLQGQIGELWIGAFTALSRQFTWGGTRGADAGYNLTKAESGALYPVRLGQIKRHRGIQFDALTAAQHEELLTFVNAAAAGLFLWVPMALNSTPTAAVDQECLLGALDGTAFDGDEAYYDVISGQGLTIIEDTTGIG